MGIFGIQVGISRITFCEDIFRGLSRLFRSLSVTSKLVRGQELQRLSWNGWKSVCSRGRPFSHLFSPFLLFLAPCFRKRGFSHKLRFNWRVLNYPPTERVNGAKLVEIRPFKVSPKNFCLYPITPVVSFAYQITVWLGTDAKRIQLYMYSFRIYTNSYDTLIDKKNYPNMQNLQG